MPQWRLYLGSLQRNQTADTTVLAGLVEAPPPLRRMAMSAAQQQFSSMVPVQTALFRAFDAGDPIIVQRRRDWSTLDSPELPFVQARMALSVVPDPSPPRRRPQGINNDVVPAAFQGRAWVDAPPKPIGRQRPVSSEAVAIGYSVTVVVASPNGWVVEAPQALPVRGRRIPAEELRILPTRAPDGFGGFVDIEVIKPRAAPFHVLPVQQVPTQFVANAWNMAWDGPRWRGLKAGAQRFDDPVLGAYATVVVTYPDGWQTNAPVSGRQPRQARGETVVSLTPAPVFAHGWAVAPQVAIVRPRPVDHSSTPPAPRTFYGWVVEAVTTPRPRRASADIPGLNIPAAVTPYGWTVAVPNPIRASRNASGGQNVAPVPAKAVPGGFDLFAGAGMPATPSRPQAGQLAVPRDVPPVAAPGNADLWGSVSYRFRRIWGMPEFYFPARARIGHAIISRPTLLGGDASPTLYGGSTAPAMLAQSAAPSLIGGSTAPSLIGGSTNPDLTGGV